MENRAVRKSTADLRKCYTEPRAARRRQARAIRRIVPQNNNPLAPLETSSSDDMDPNHAEPIVPIQQNNAQGDQPAPQPAHNPPSPVPADQVQPAAAVVPAPAQVPVAPQNDTPRRRSSSRSTQRDTSYDHRLSKIETLLEEKNRKEEAYRRRRSPSYRTRDKSYSRRRRKSSRSERDRSRSRSTRRGRRSTSQRTRTRSRSSTRSRHRSGSYRRRHRRRSYRSRSRSGSPSSYRRRHRSTSRRSHRHTRSPSPSRRRESRENGGAGAENGNPSPSTLRKDQEARRDATRALDKQYSSIVKPRGKRLPTRNLSLLPYRNLPPDLKTEAAKRASRRDLSFSEHMCGMLRLILKTATIDPEHRAALTHVAEVAQDATTIPWVYVRKWTQSCLSSMQEGDIKWQDTDAILQERMRLSWVEGRRHKVEKIPCPAHNQEGCQETGHHDADGKRWIHACAVCYYGRNDHHNTHAAGYCKRKAGLKIMQDDSRMDNRRRPRQAGQNRDRTERDQPKN